MKSGGRTLNEEMTITANNVFKALDLEHTGPRKALFILGTLCGLVIGSYSIDQEKVLSDVEKLIRESSETTGKFVHRMQKAGSKKPAGEPNGGSNTVH